MLDIKNLNISVENKPILKDFSLTIKPGEIHSIMGPNGSGKSTLAKILAGHPSYQNYAGKITFKRKDLAKLTPNERVHSGLFIGFQHPIEVPGVNNWQFLFTAYNTKRTANKKSPLSPKEFDAHLAKVMQELDLPKEFLQRNLNEGFSGGEKKRNEILQMALLDPDLAVLDEIDSGLDIDSLRTAAFAINSLMTPKKSLILITHYSRLLKYIQPDFIHIFVDGKIVKSGDAKLSWELEETGYTELSKCTQCSEKCYE